MVISAVLVRSTNAYVTVVTYCTVRTFRTSVRIPPDEIQAGANDKTTPCCGSSYDRTPRCILRMELLYVTYHVRYFRTHGIVGSLRRSTKI